MNQIIAKVAQSGYTHFTLFYNFIAIAQLVRGSCVCLIIWWTINIMVYYIRFNLFSARGCNFLYGRPGNWFFNQWEQCPRTIYKSMFYFPRFFCRCLDVTTGKVGICWIVWLLWNKNLIFVILRDQITVK